VRSRRAGKLAFVPEPDVVPRRAGRVLVVDARGQVLLLHGFDPARWDEPYWFTVGGGAKPGESLAEAAARELLEETGLTATAAELGEPVWHEVAEFSFAGTRYRQEQDFFLLRIGSAQVSRDGLAHEEAAVIDGYRWWSVAELDATAESFYPRDLPRLLRELLPERHSSKTP
jgi:8-oxo-dGTP pyrophosphatase MutT (NUDIX family)